MKKGFYLLLTLLVLALAACEHKELCFEHPHYTTIRITFDWGQKADSDSIAGMRVVFFNVDGTADPWMFDFKYGTNEEYRKLPAGEYQVVTYNYDADGFEWENANSYALITAKGNSTVSITGETGVLTPSLLYSDNIADINVRDAKENDTTYITLTPRRRVAHYTYEVNGITGLANISSMQAGLTNMYGDVIMVTDSLGNSYKGSTNLLVFSTERKNRQLLGDFYTFGSAPLTTDGQTGHNIFKLYIVDMMGGGHVITQDVTSQIHNSLGSGNSLRDIHLVIDTNFIVPRDTINGNGGGLFDVSTDDWDEVNEEIKF